jgi:hypothetical protein
VNGLSDELLGTTCSITSALARMKELCEFVEGKGMMDGWSLGLGVEVVRDSGFAGAGLDGRKKDHSYTYTIILVTLLHSSCPSPFLATTLAVSTSTIHLFFPLFLLPWSEILQRQFDAWWRSQREWI